MITKTVTSVALRNVIVGKSTTGARHFGVSTARCGSIKIQSAADFKAKVINSKVPVVVDFFATWCNPCKLLTPRIESVIAEQKGKVILAKVDIDEQTDLALDYDVSSVPVLVAISKGKELNRVVGLQDTDKLRKWIEQLTKAKEVEGAPKTKV